MYVTAALVILAMAIVGGLALYLPFFVWFRWRSRQMRRRGGGVRSFHVTRYGFCLYGVILAVLFAGLGYGQVAPDSWFGAQVRTLFGGFGFGSAVCLVASAIERFFLKRGVVFAYHSPRSNGATSPSSGASNTLA